MINPFIPYLIIIYHKRSIFLLSGGFLCLLDIHIVSFLCSVISCFLLLCMLLYVPLLSLSSWLSFQYMGIGTIFSLWKFAILVSFHNRLKVCILNWFEDINVTGVDHQPNELKEDFYFYLCNDWNNYDTVLRHPEKCLSDCSKV